MSENQDRVRQDATEPVTEVVGAKSDKITLVNLVVGFFAGVAAMWGLHAWFFQASNIEAATVTIFVAILAFGVFLTREVSKYYLAKGPKPESSGRSY